MLKTIDAQAVDDLFNSEYLPDQPGAAVIIAQDGQPLFRKGYGMANIELDVPMAPDMVFRIGSVTKQFTATAILMLMEQGLLKLDDPIEKFIPDYPVHGHTITIEHLLTHTSGIKSYTSMPEFEKIIPIDMTTEEMVNLFKGQPMDFAPGKQWSYNNSGYFLLGVIIEKLSGLSYGEFLQKRIFDPLGLRSTYYDSPKQIIPRRASGYGKVDETLINDRYLSMTIPYAAGALASTVDDLAAWDAALYSGKLVSLESLQRAWTSYRLPDGKDVHYGYGWAVHQYQGHTWLEHNGGINGFLCSAIRLPDEHLFITVLTNTTAPQHGPDEMASRAAMIALNFPHQPLQPVELPAGELEKLAGVYEVRPGEEFIFTIEDGKIKSTRKDWPELFLSPVGEDRLFCDRFGLNLLYVQRDESGQPSGFEMRNLFNEVDIIARKIDSPLPSASAETA